MQQGVEGVKVIGRQGITRRIENGQDQLSGNPLVAGSISCGFPGTRAAGNAEGPKPDLRARVPPREAAKHCDSSSGGRGIA
jgi:hypothetical protein